MKCPAYTRVLSYTKFYFENWGFIFLICYYLMFESKDSFFFDLFFLIEGNTTCKSSRLGFS